MSRCKTPALALLSALIVVVPGTVLAASNTKVTPPAAAGAVAKPPGYEPGEKWRTTMSMSAMGMTMPGMSNNVCVPKDGDASQAGLDENCQTSNMRRSGNKVSYHVVCTGKNAMEGDMEIENLGPDHYRGQMIALVEGEQMTMKYEGQKQPGECDAGAMKRKINAIVAEGNAQTAKLCSEGAKNLQAQLFVGATATCKDPKDKQTFCSAAQAHKGFGGLSQQERWARKSAVKGQVMALSDTAKFCGFAADAKRKELCGSAQGKKAWAFLANECPEIADPLAQRECAGRDFTTPVSPPFVEFCDAYGKDRSLSDAAAGAGESGGNAAASSSGAGQDPAAGAEGENGEPQKESAGDKAKKGLKKLKGLFGN